MGTGYWVLGIGDYSDFIYPLPFPLYVYSQFIGGYGYKFSHRMLLACGNDKIFGLVLLEHEPLHLNVIFGMSPVTLGIQVAKVETILKVEADAGQGTGDLAGDKGLAAQGGLMVKEDTIAGIYAIGFR